MNNFYKYGLAALAMVFIYNPAGAMGEEPSLLPSVKTPKVTIKNLTKHNLHIAAIADKGFVVAPKLLNRNFPPEQIEVPRNTIIKLLFRTNKGKELSIKGVKVTSDYPEFTLTDEDFDGIILTVKDDKTESIYSGLWKK